VARIVADETLLVFLSDCHIGGDDGRDIFESPGDLVALFDELAAHRGPLELVLAGDFFDCLRISKVADGQTRVGATIARPEHADLFAALKRLAAGTGRRVTYLPGNHDAEVWWNEKIRDELKRAGLVHDFALSYATAFASDPGAVIYCEHGNEFDPANTKHNYSDAWDTPFGDHIVTDIIPRLPRGRTADALQLHEIERVFPLDTIPAWIASKLFYTLVTGTIRWLLLPLAVAYVAFELVAYAVGFGTHAIHELFVEIAYDLAVIVVAAAFFFFLARRLATRAMRAATPAPDEAEVIRARLEEGTRPPMVEDDVGAIAVFVSGHTHAPSLASFTRAGRRGRGQLGLLAQAIAAGEGAFSRAGGVCRPLRADPCSRGPARQRDCRGAVGAPSLRRPTPAHRRAAGDLRPAAAGTAAGRTGAHCRFGQRRFRLIDGQRNRPSKAGMLLTAAKAMMA
jgi:UDP-2,3-diacylglucosamine pyrophosphatase LpxH